MKSFFTAFVFLIALHCFIPSAAAREVRMPDPYLRAVVRHALSLAPGEPITRKAMSRLESLEDRFIPVETSKVDLQRYLAEEQVHRDNKITQLTGLEHAANLKHLSLQYHSIRDLTPLSGLTQLGELSLDGNQITDITPLSELTQLSYLSLYDNGIVDITPLSELTQLGALPLGRNHIRDLTPLSGLTQLTWLGLDANEIVDITPLSGLTQLDGLSLSVNHIRDLTPLSGLTQLTWLSLEACQIGDLTPLSGLTLLNRLSLQANQITDITPLSGLTQLAWLSLEANQIADITVLAGLVNLKAWLGLGENQIRDLTPLAGLVHLTGLGLHDNQIRDLTPLAALKNLERLDLAKNQISDLTPLSGLTQLQLLDLGCNQIRDLTPLRHLTALETLVLVGNPVPRKALKPLNRLPHLTLLWVSGESPPRPTGGTFHSTRHTSSFYRGGHCSTEAPLTPGSGGVAVDTTAHPPIYWVDSQASTLHIFVGNNATSRIIPRLRNAIGLTIDVAKGTLYWTQKTGNRTGALWRSNLDGSNVARVKALTSVPLGIAMDPTQGKLYLTNSWGKIQRMNLNGTAFEPNFITGLDAPTDIAIDRSGGQLYWTEKTGDSTGRIRRSNLDGSNVTLVKALTSVPLGIAMDPTQGKLYLTNSWGKIQRMNLNGTAFEPNFITGLDVPTDIAMDVINQTLYWAERKRLRRRDLSGEVVEDVFAGLKRPMMFVLGISSPSPAAPAHRLLAPSQTTPAQDGAVPAATLLLANYPNPFNPETWIPYQLTEPAEVHLTVYDIEGRVVRALALGHQRAGIYRRKHRAAYWDGKNAFGEPVASGVYFYTLTAGDFAATRKMLIRR